MLMVMDTIIKAFSFYEKRAGGLAVKIVCPNCGEYVSVKAVKAAGQLYCERCQERFKINERPNPLILFLVRLVLLVGLGLLLWSVTKVNFMPKWLYVVIVLMVMLSLALLSIYVLNIFTVMRQNKRARREIEIRK